MAFSAVLAGNIQKFLQRNDDVITHSYLEQKKVEASVLKNYENYKQLADRLRINLLRSKHLKFLKNGLTHLSEGYECLDASRPWLCFWILHSLELLDEPLPEEICISIADFLRRCQDKEKGGFGGGPGQLPHLAPTYAAVCALCILGRYWKKAYDVIDRVKLAKFLNNRRTSEGSFTMQHDGEVDIRGAYCAVVAARLANVFTREMFKGTGDWIKRCQTYEGGFAGLPGLEAHGGYSFCGYAALVLLGQEQKADTKRLLKWTVNRQMKLEGGFQGRTNKLVDGCYSYWQGALFPVLHNILTMYGDENLSQTKWMFNQRALEEYVILNCQSPNGGLIDKPGKSRDYYHTCYCLSGLSIAEHFIVDDIKESDDIVGGKQNVLQPLHPIYNICLESAHEALCYFNRLPVPE